MSSPAEDVGNQNATGARPPVFDGEPSKYLRWVRLVGLWFSLCKTQKQKEEAGAKLVGVQTSDEVLNVMLEISNEDIGKADGVEQILKKMNDYYMKDDHHLAWAAFYDFYTGRRANGQSGHEFVRQFKQNYHKVTDHDKECNVSERMLSMMLLMQLALSDTNTSLLLTTMTALNDHSMNGVERAITSQFRSGLPEPVSQSGKVDAESSFKATEKVLVMKHADGSLTQIDDDGTKYFPADFAEQQLAFLGFNRFKGKGAGKGQSTRRHPKEGDARTNTKNGKDKHGNIMSCYDCGSLFHLSGSPICKELSMFARVDPEEYEYAGFAAAEADILQI